MSQRLHNLSKWIVVEEGRSLSFAKAKRRTVLLDVNCPTEVGFYILQEGDAVEMNPERIADSLAGRKRRGSSSASEANVADGPLQFLGLAKGRERFEFAVDGGFTLIPEGGAAYVYTADGLQVETHIVAPVIFTRIANRRARNYQLELMAFRMRMNENARMQALEAESERRVAALEARLERYLPERTGAASLGRASVAQGRPAGQSAVGADDVDVEQSHAEVVVDDAAPARGGRKKRSEPAGATGGGGS